MPSRRFGRPAMVVATLIAFSVLTLVFIGEGLKAFVRKDGASMGKRDIIFGLNWHTTIFTPSTGRSEISALDDCSPGSSDNPTPLVIDHIQPQRQAIGERSTMVSAILAQGTNTVSFALQGRSDMVSVILANINSLVTHPTGISNTVRDASGLLAIAMAKSNPSVTRPSVPAAATPTDLHSFAAFELLKKATTFHDRHDFHGEACDCAACILSSEASIPITAASPLPTHELMARAFGARAETVTVTVSVCEDTTPKVSNSAGSGNQSPPSASAPASNSTLSGPKNPSPAPETSNSTSSGPTGPSGAKGPQSPSNSTSSGPKNPAPVPENANPTSPSRPNPPFANGTDTGSGVAAVGSGSPGSGSSGSGSSGSGSSGSGSSGSDASSGAGGAASASGAVASAASLFSGNSSQPTGNAQPSNNAGGQSTSASKSTPAENTSPVTSASISPPIASQASAASSGIDNSIFSVITPGLSNIVYIIWTIAPIAGMVIMGQIWLL
ncbi:hypothetical protein EYC84_006080 [Monilinia fructicola]|uniref:Uncharacterized protein n=1 Tax=Monilinia fructicola TaxID=38448 RepID=A0A5M9KAI3_MONFR|nr:hypothetical protein EYC84_006080 [Monilinia fructicola]